MKIIAALLCCFALVAQAETLDARVIAVLDGDTVLVLAHNRKIKVRMANIDAPEKDQAFGMQSRDSLLEMIGGQQVRIATQAVDKYGRTIGTITLNGRDINKEQLRLGMAWENSHYHADKVFLALQKEAQQLRRGLWSQADPQAPWDWRKQHPNSGGAVRTDFAANCGTKKTCQQMATCDEAFYYLTRCGVKSLDGNKDGVPCASLCADKKKSPSQ